VARCARGESPRRDEKRMRNVSDEKGRERREAARGAVGSERTRSGEGGSRWRTKERKERAFLLVMSRGYRRLA